MWGLTAIQIIFLHSTNVFLTVLMGKYIVVRQIEPLEIKEVNDV